MGTNKIKNHPDLKSLSHRIHFSNQTRGFHQHFQHTSIENKELFNYLKIDLDSIISSYGIDLLTIENFKQIEYGISSKLKHPKNLYNQDGVVVYFIETDNYYFYTNYTDTGIFRQDKNIKEVIFNQKFEENKRNWKLLLDELTKEEFIEHISQYVFPTKLIS